MADNQDLISMDSLLDVFLTGSESMLQQSILVRDNAALCLPATSVWVSRNASYLEYDVTQVSVIIVRMHMTSLAAVVNLRGLLSLVSTRVTA
jgi:hypothetical protein